MAQRAPAVLNNQTEREAAVAAAVATPSLFSTLTLNTNRLGDLAGLPALLRELRPDVAFLQEVAVSVASLSAAVSGLGYKVWTSSCDRPRRTIAVLSRRPAKVSEIVPGYLQKVTLHHLVFLHFHCPSGAEGRDHRHRLFLQCRPIISSLSSPPFLVGDFNCIIHRDDVEIFEQYKLSPALVSIVSDFLYCDSYRILHPCTKQFSWFRRNMSASRLDRLYLPKIFESSPRIARYIPTASDHSAFYLVLDQAALGLRLDPVPAASNFYWKLNSSLLADAAFLPAFTEFWRPLAAAAASHPGGEATWWELDAKPAVVNFCSSFSRTVAARAAQTRRFFTRALELALAASDWPTVDGCRGRLRALDAVAAAGLSVRAHQPLLEGEIPGIFHLAAEGRHGRSPGLEAVKAADGTILRDPEAVQREVFSYFETLFNGRHQATAASPEPFDSGISFTPDFNCVGQFLDGLPTLSAEQRDSLDLPFSLAELEAAVLGAVANKSPGLDGLSYEFYRATFSLVGRPLLAALNDMLARGELGVSLRRGVVRLIPKVRGIPTAAQLRPITLLCTDYKLLTKMLVARLIVVLPDILQATQLCSIRGRSIFDGAAAILSAIEYLKQRRLPGFLVSLDLFHAYDRVSLQWVDRVLEAMGFGRTVRRWVAIFHQGAMAKFMLHSLTPDLPISFSIRQGDPLAMVLFVIQIEPLLVVLQRRLTGLQIGNFREASFGYVDDVAVLSEDEADLPRLDSAVRDFELASGAILNRNRKSMILGLGSWEARSVWPLPWIHSSLEVKVYGVIMTASHDLTVRLSWDRVISGLESVLQLWTARFLPTLLVRRQALEVYAFSTLWYLAQIIPLPTPALARIKKAAGKFLWKGRLERLAWSELHGPLRAGGIGLPCVATRAQSLLAKQACHRLAGGGRPAAHLSYWIGLRLRDHLPAIGLGPNAEAAPAFMVNLSRLLLKVFALECVDLNALDCVAAREVYLELKADPLSPKIEARLPALGWNRIWCRLAVTGLPPLVVDVGFSYLHNILPLQVRLHRFAMAASPACLRCGAAMEDVLHFFTVCPRVADAWAVLSLAAGRALGGAIPDRSLLFLHLPLHVGELAVVLAVLTFAELAWSTRDVNTPISPLVLKARVRTFARGHLQSVFDF